MIKYITATITLSLIVIFFTHFASANYGKHNWECYYNCYPSPTPSVSPSPEASPSPEVSPSPIPCEQTEEGCPVEPSPTPIPEEPRIERFSNPGVPQCVDQQPEKAPANFQMSNPTIGDNKLTLTWNTDNGQNHGDKVFIAYDESKGGEKYGVEAPNSGIFEVGQLSNSQHYWFKIRYQNGCQPGPWTTPIDPMP